MALLYPQLNTLIQIILHGTHAQINDPQIGQARGDQQLTQPLGIAEVTFVDVEPTAFLVREEGLDVRTVIIQRHGRVQISQIGDQIESAP